MRAERWCVKSVPLQEFAGPDVLDAPPVGRLLSPPPFAGPGAVARRSPRQCPEAMLLRQLSTSI